MEAATWRDHWNRVRIGTLATIDMFQEDELGFAPIGGGYTIRELALHIAHEEEIEILHGLARVVELPAPYPASRFPSKAAILDQLRGVHAHALVVLGGFDEAAMMAEVEMAWGERLRPIDVMLHLIEHEIHHRGELSLAVGLLGRRGLDA